MLNFFQFSSTATKTTLSNDQTLREHLNDFMNQVGGQARAISNKHKFGKKKKFNPQSLPDSSKKPKGESGNLTFREIIFVRHLFYRMLLKIFMEFSFAGFQVLDSTIKVSSLKNLAKT